MGYNSTALLSVCLLAHLGGHFRVVDQVPQHTVLLAVVEAADVHSLFERFSGTGAGGLADQGGGGRNSGESREASHHGWLRFNRLQVATTGSRDVEGAVDVRVVVV